MRRLPLRGRLFCFLLACIFVSCGGRNAQPEPQHLEVKTATEAGKALIQRASKTGATSILILTTAQLNDWQLMATRAALDGYTTMVVQVVRPASGDWHHTLALAEKAVSIMRESGSIDIAIGGEAVAGNLALHVAQRDPSIAAVFCISPGLEYDGVDVEDLVEDIEHRPLLFTAAQNDAYSASSASTLKSLSQGYSELRIFDGSAHGTDLLVAHPNVIDQILEWLRPILGKDVSKVK